MPSISARAPRRRPEVLTSRGLRAVAPDGPANAQAVSVLLVLITVSLLFTALTSPGSVPWAAFLPAIVISGVMHRPTEHALIAGFSLSAIVIGGVLLNDTRDALGSFVAGMLIAAVTMWRSSWRARVGVQGRGGETLLYELSGDLKARACMPQLISPWRVESCVNSAHGHPFSGDFIVAHRNPGSDRVEIVLVDVSGKGLKAASRAVQLSGALDALLGAVPAHQFLAAANDYVLRQGWQEGFATAIHLFVDLGTGEFLVRRAGHPPAATFLAGCGDWEVLDGRGGPALGLLPGADYPCESGTLNRGDAVLLYSDGLVEKHDRTLDDGIDRLLGKAEYLVPCGFTGGAQELCDQAASGEDDDRAVVLFWHD
ncbi:PP2C family protein-serine/threonine phosphatase [Gephyromycinifex aptenodytis]|uniref:PP2C family protein-serine/threonine phosphatase n=1 Tax=Gephyromycinifex aptenodytis TaxID=2716227 RepID=UPI0014487E79|nr:PP2C family protein-serine/threonine phosphatase [Gephyromycinifex aptenodytis]